MLKHAKNYVDVDAGLLEGTELRSALRRRFTQSLAQEMVESTTGVSSLVMGLHALSTLRTPVACQAGPASVPPRGMNSFDIQYARRSPNSTVPVWNETEFRKLATALASPSAHGLRHNCDRRRLGSDTIDEHGR